MEELYIHLQHLLHFQHLDYEKLKILDINFGFAQLDEFHNFRPK